jgi:hypothetical protein
MHMKLLASIWENQDGRSNHVLFQCVEALLAFFCPDKLTLFLKNILHWRGDIDIPFDEFPVIDSMAQRSAQLFD